MRIRKCASLATALLILTASAAHALPSISIIWQDSGSSALDSPAVSSTVVANIVLTGDPAAPEWGVVGVFITIEYDPTELLGIEAREGRDVRLGGMSNLLNPIGVGVVHDAENARFTNFDMATLTVGLFQGRTRTLGSVTFHVLAPSGNASDVDVVASVNNVGIDDITIRHLSGVVESGTAVFVGAAVVPEPGLAELLVVGLVGLGWAARSRGR